MSINGNCKCGKISYEITGQIKNVVNCHCNFCRSMNGASFSTYIIVHEQNFNLKSGQSNLKGYKVSSNATKFFCDNCGSPIYNSNPRYAGFNILYLGMLNNANQYTPQVNIYCDNKLNWLDGLFTIKNFNEGVKRD